MKNKNLPPAKNKNPVDEAKVKGEVKKIPLAIAVVIKFLCMFEVESGFNFFDFGGADPLLLCSRGYDFATGGKVAASSLLDLV